MKKANFEAFSAGAALLGIRIERPSRRDNQNIWVWGDSDTARAKMHELADGMGIPRDARNPKYSKVGRAMRIAIAAFDHVPLKKIRVVTLEHTMSDGDVVLIRRRETY